MRLARTQEIAKIAGIPEFLDSGQNSWTLDSGHWTLDSGRWTLKDSRRWTLDSGRWTLDPVFDFA